MLQPGVVGLSKTTAEKLRRYRVQVLLGSGRIFQPCCDPQLIKLESVAWHTPLLLLLSCRLGRCFPCIASRERRRSTREETDLAEQFAMQFAASMYGGGARPSTDTQLTTVTSRSALHYHSSTGSASSDQEENGDVGHAAPSAGGGHEFGRQLSSPPVERLPVVREYEGYVVDPTVQQIESSL